jgi:hypothetical protein
MTYQRNAMKPYALPAGYANSGQLASDARSVLKGYTPPYSQVGSGQVGSGRVPWAAIFADKIDGPVLYSSYFGISDPLGRMGKFAWRVAGPHGIVSETADDFVYIIDATEATTSLGTRDSLAEAINIAQAETDWFVNCVKAENFQQICSAAMRTNLVAVSNPGVSYYGMVVFGTIPGEMPTIGFETAGVVSLLEVTAPGTYDYTPNGILVYGDPDALLSAGENFSWFTEGEPYIESSPFWQDTGSDSTLALPGMFGQNFAFLPTDQAPPTEYY